MKTKLRKLDNGIPVLYENVENINSVAFGIYVKTGARNEKVDESGISHYIEHMLFKGTTTKSAKEISEAIDMEGGTINAYTSRDVTCYYVRMLASKIEKGIEVLVDMLLNSTFTQENLEKERNVIIEEIRMYDDIPEEVVHEENIRFAVTGSQVNSISGTEESVRAIDREKFLDYFKAQYKPENIVIAVAGKIDIDKIIEQLNKELGKWENNSVSREMKTEYTINSGKNLIKKQTNQIHLCYNTRGVSELDERRYVAGVLFNALAGNMSSRLFQKIREEKGLAYSVYGYPTPFNEDGVYTIYAGTTKEGYEEVLDIIKNELKDVRENGITEDELQKAKNKFLSIITFSMEDSKGKISRMASSYLNYGEIKDIQETIDAIEKITIEEVKEVAKVIFDEKYHSYTVLGDI